MTFQLHELYVIDNLRITEYTTRYGLRRFDIQPWRGELFVRVPVENSDGTWIIKEYDIQFWRRPQGSKDTTL